jgi:hypothetical protein
MSSSDSDDKPLVKASPFKAVAQPSPAKLACRSPAPRVEASPFKPVTSASPCQEAQSTEEQELEAEAEEEEDDDVEEAPSPEIASRMEESPPHKRAVTVEPSVPAAESPPHKRAARVEESSLRAAESPPHKRAATANSSVRAQAEKVNAEVVSVPAQVAACKARLAELQKQKAVLLDQEDYMGAHHLKEQIKEQEQNLTLLRRQLDSMPTPARRASIAASKVSVGSGRAGKSPHSTGHSGRSSASALPHANAWARPYPLAASLSRMGVPPMPVITPPSLQADVKHDALQRRPAEDMKEEMHRGAAERSGAPGREAGREKNAQCSEASEESAQSEEADEELAESEGSEEQNGQWRTNPKCLVAVSQNLARPSLGTSLSVMKHTV